MSSFRRGKAFILAAILAASAVTAGCGSSDQPAAGSSDQPAAGSSEAASSAEEAASGEETDTQTAETEIDIENNGSYFVRVGNKVYFRRYGDKALENVSLGGEFLENRGTAGAVSSMMAFDLETGGTEEAFADSGYGRIFAGGGGFYCKKAGSDYGDAAYWIAADGTGVIDLGQGEPLGISRAEGGTEYVTLRDQSADSPGDVFIVSGMKETARAARSPQESLEYCGMAGEYAVYMNCDTDAGTNLLYSLSGKTGEIVCLGEMPVDKGEYQYPYLEAEQMLSDEKGVYLVASNYEGTGHFRSYSLAVSAVPGVEGSLQLIERDEAYQEGGEEAPPPVLYLTEAGKPEIVPGTPGKAGLSDTTYGDLIYYDSPYSAVRLVFDFLPETDPEDTQKKVLQTAEVIGDSVYVILADAERDEKDDIGWRWAYSLKGMTWERIPVAEGLAQEGSSTPETLCSMSIAGEGIYLGNLVGSWKLYSYESEGEYLPAEENGVDYLLTIHENGTADFEPKVNGVESLGANGMEISQAQSGALTFGFMDAETGWNSFEVFSCENDVLLILYTYHFGDGSTGLMREEYHRAN